MVLTQTEVRQILDCVRRLPYRVCLTTIYSCGLRLGEAIRLEVGDVDGERELLHIRQAKGGRDRYVPLPQSTLELLRQQWASHRHATLLFPSRFRCSPSQATWPLGPTSVQKAFKAALANWRLVTVTDKVVFLFGRLAHESGACVRCLPSNSSVVSCNTFGPKALLRCVIMASLAPASGGSFIRLWPGSRRHRLRRHRLSHDKEPKTVRRLIGSRVVLTASNHCICCRS